MTAPLVSVVLPTRDRPSLLAEALQSVLGQSHRQLEVIVVNNGRPLGGRAAARVAADGRVCLIDLDHAVAPSEARSIALGRAHGEIVAYLDDDDLMCEEHVATLVAALPVSGTREVAFTDAVHHHLVERRGIWTVRERRPGLSCELDRRRLLVANQVPLICIGHTMAAYRRCGGFDRSLRSLEDWDLLLRLTRNSGATHVGQATAIYRHFDGLSHVNALSDEAIDSTRRIYAAHPVADPELEQARRAHLGGLAAGIRLGRRGRLSPPFGQTLGRASDHLVNGNLPLAERVISDLAEQLPQDGELLLLLARIKRARGEARCATTLASLARERDPYLFEGPGPVIALTDPVGDPVGDQSYRRA